MVKTRTIKLCLVLFLPTFFSVSSGFSQTLTATKEVKSFLTGKRAARSAGSLEWSGSSEFSDEPEFDSESDEEVDPFQEDFQRSRISRNVPARAIHRKPLPIRFKKPLRPNSPRQDIPCDNGRNNDNGQPQPWGVDTGVVPDSLQGGGANDGLDGISGSTPKTDVPWSDIFNANPVDNGNPPADGGSDWGNTNSDGGNNPTPVDNGGSDWGNTNNDDGSSPAPVDDGGSDWGNNNNGDGSTPAPVDDGGSDWGNNNNGDGSSPAPVDDGGSDWGNNNNGDEQTWPPADSTDQTETTENSWGSSSVTGNQEEPDCTCMSIMACGGTFRSGDVGPDICADGEVCCPVEKTGLPDDTTPPVPPIQTPYCGMGNPNKSVKARVMTESTALFGELPWTALLLTKQDDEDAMFCAGTIVDLQVVVTAAHCLERFKSNPDSIIIRGGEWDVSTWGREPLPPQDRSVQSITFHPMYRSGHPIYDLAIILLREPFTFAENLNTVCLPSDFGKIDETRCVASGWGKYPKDQQQEVMKKIVLPVVSRDQCQQALRTTRLGKYFRLHKSFICAGANGNDVCLGDGGGPLTCPMVNADGSDTMVLMGVTSWGIDCGLPGIPGVFADIPSEQRWLKDTIALLRPQN